MEGNGCEGSNSNQNIATQYALHVALQTMKERCLCQQKRLAEMEEENQRLRNCLATDEKITFSNIQNNSNEIVENFQLRLQVAELQQQKEQLNAHINMVSNENRKLWSRLSQITKGNAKVMNGNISPLFSEHGSGSGTLVLAAHQNLIRSKTFTQHSPNPNLRHKLIATEKVDYMVPDAIEDDMAILHSGVEGKSNVDIVGGNDFGYLHTEEELDDNAGDIQHHDFSTEAKKCIEGLQEMRREAMKQQQDLNTLFAVLESRNINSSAGNCVCERALKPETADKSLETDVHLANDVGGSEGFELLLDDLDGKRNKLQESNPVRLGTYKLQTDNTSKICPMCGAIFDSHVTFELFCEHVEEHFSDDSVELDYSSERNFEIVSATMGNF